MSPFNIAGTASTNTPLTVGDVISQLPPELVRGGALPPEQPLSLPPALLENALRGGLPELPVFELYRVCPALFQTPVSPQDPRMVTLPPAKLPGLIAKAREGHGQMNGNGMPQGSSAAFATPVSPFAAGVPASPFAPHAPASVQGAGAASPFSVGPASPSPFLAVPASAPPAPSPFQMAQPGAEPPASGVASFPMSPFAAAASPFSMGKGVESAASGKAAPGVFSIATEPGPAAGPAPSPFGMSAAPQQSVGGITSLFTPKPQESVPAPVVAQPAAPAPGPGVPAPFGMAGASLLGGTPFGSPPAATAAGGSPFSASQSGASAGLALASAAPVQQVSPFAVQPTAGGAAAHFGMPPSGGQPVSPLLNGASPFGSTPGGAPSPFMGGAAAPAAGGSSLAASAADGSSFPVMQAAAAQARPVPMQPAAPAFGADLTLGSPPPAAASGGGAQGLGAGSGTVAGQAKLGFAAVLHGFSADDLGFNPAMVPAWITSQLPASTLKDQISSGAVVVELGALIDGISDVGFRNTLSSAKRSVQIKLPQNEVFHALSGSAPATPSAPLGVFSAPKPAPQPPVGMGGSGAFVIQPGAPAGQVSRVEPAAQPASSPVPSLFSGGMPASPFGQPVAAAPGPEPAAFTAPASRPMFGSGPSAAAPAPAAAAPFMGMGGGVPAAAAPAQQQPAILSAFGAPPAAVMPAAVPAAPAFSFPQAPAAAPAPMPQQSPASGMFKPLGGAAVSAFGSPPPGVAPATSSLGMVNKPFDPFAAPASHAGALMGGAAAAAPARSPAQAQEAGLSSAQLLGQSAGFPAAVSQLPAFSTPPVLQPRAAESAASQVPAIASAFGTPPASAGIERAQPAFVPASFAPALEARPSPAAASIPLFSEPVPAPQPASRPLFGEVKPGAVGAAAAPATFAFSPSPSPSASPSAFLPGGGSAASMGSGQAQMPLAGASAGAATSAKAGKHSFLGLAPLDTQTDQLLLRALLGTEENLTAQRVVELLASQPGLSACVCLKNQGSQVLSHADRSKPDAAEFQRQAPDIARQLRGLAPLIGIDGAETFTLNAGGRLITFCFPGGTTVGVLHDEEPSTGVRDKITLIARELARMLG